MSAGIALLHPTPPNGGATGAEVMKSCPLGSRDSVPPAAHRDTTSRLVLELGGGIGRERRGFAFRSKFRAFIG
jgi:hypothetical protein